MEQAERGVQEKNIELEKQRVSSLIAQKVEEVAAK